MAQSQEDEGGTIPTEHHFAGVKRVVTLHAHVSKPCPHCRERVTSSMTDDGYLEDGINHYLGHGYKILHVGSETTRDDEGAQWQSTVAVLGAVDPPPVLPPLGELRVASRKR